MDVTLTSELEETIQEMVASGRYSSVTEVVREALRLMVERDQLVKSQRESLRRDVQAGLEQLDRGESVTATPQEIMEEVDARLRQKP